VTAVNLDQLERAGRIVNAVGVPLMLVLFIAVYFGWMPNPMMSAILGNRHILETRLTVDEKLVRDAERTLAELRDTIRRLTEVLKFVDCGEIKDLDLRKQCFAR
jgi:hypothetical protein